MSPTRTTPQLLTSLTTGWNDAMQQWWDQSQAAFDPWRQSWETMMPGVAGQTLGMPSGRHHAHGSGSGCGCEPDGGCGCGDKHRHEHGPGHEHAHEHADTSCGCEDPCRCCIPGADVVLHARAGEQRVIPFLLRNPWRREREVTITVGPWQVCHGSRLEVRSMVDAGESLTLQPCESRVVRLGVLVRGIRDDGQDTKDDNKGDVKGDNKNDVKDDQKDDNRFGSDVESSASAYADVRFEGCARPQRVAVVVHPASCDAVELPCDCGCCCP